ncbi:MAG: hypothetical protein IPO09_20635 [Anaeromyxobacter sp.]|nr:hypothetical protein [Anaeromyxobacter sp.]
MTNEEKRKIYAALAAPFPEHCIQRTDGRVTGRGYDTSGIGYAFITARLNEVVGLGNWRAHRTVTVKEITRANGRTAFEAICDLTLELGEWVDGAFVTWAESLADGGNVAASEADARKGAYTNALKKGAAMFGCGRQAYEGTLDDDNLPPEHSSDGGTISTLPTPRPAPAPAPVVQGQVSQQPAQQVQQQPRPPQAPPAPSRNRLTSKQLGAIQAIARKLGYDPQGLRAFVKGQFGAQPEFLSRDQASKLISAMSAQAGNGQAQEQHEPGAEG